ncbi:MULTISPECIES: HNH endonuclease [Stenotrophomonas]|uniref:HNH endonuclease n=1 Tax=Stenotrophomonas TaxID=40323 RepID=UPI0012B4FF5B|nr:HNH endonuclease [[Pseudomonas] hibiscicola]MBO0395076.1 HNH endonuclease [Stenotrophomonas maltophilia]QGL87142.1 HNH endonuclease [Stenotrophomonas maltophilia]
MAYWWVNQKQTFDRAVKAGYLWSPKTNVEGKTNPFYEHMTQVRPGDVVFAFANTRIRAVAVVNGVHYAKDRPDEFRKTDNEWRKDGWAVPVDYHLMEVPLKVSDHMAKIGPRLPEKYSPLKLDGKANQAYLFPVPEAMATELLALLNVDIDQLGDWQDEVSVKQIKEDNNIGETVRAQLINARVGQGIYRKSVSDIEKSCRVTGTSEPKFLIASHIKPWAKSTNDERLDGNNGLMLAPHIDRLFDRGYISFEDDGRLVVSSQLPEAVRLKWDIVQKISNVPFSAAQVYYLNYHRDVLLRK